MNNPGKDLADFSELIREHQAGLRAFVRSIGAFPDWVDDIAQRTFLIAWQESDRFEGGGDFGKWLRGIARNVVMNERRKSARHNRILHEKLSDILMENSCQDDQAEQDADPATLLGSLKECLKQLPEKSRTLLIKRYGHNRNASELSAVLGVKAEAVRQTLLRVRIKVRECMEQKAGESPA